MKGFLAMNKTRYSIIGSGYFIKIFDKNHPLYIKLKSIKCPDIMSYLQDYNSIKELDLKDEFGYTYSSFFEIKPSKMLMAYSTDIFTRLEIRTDKYKPIKLFFKDLIRTDYLFPPNYIINESTLENAGLLVIEYDKGFFGSTKHLHQFEREDQLSFDIISIPQLGATAIKSIKVNGDEVILKQPDTLNYFINGYLI